jgi:hypothetical protein
MVGTLISRTLVYGGLSACVVGVYILLVGPLGAIAGAHGGPVVSLLAAGLVAVLFQPLRERLQRGVNHLCLEIVDDGIGLPTVPRAGVGLTSIRERAAELGGTCTIDRGPTGGTRVKAQLPLGKPSAVAGQRPVADDDRPGVPDADEAGPRIGGDG